MADPTSWLASLSSEADGSETQGGASVDESSMCSKFARHGTSSSNGKMRTMAGFSELAQKLLDESSNMSWRSALSDESKPLLEIRAESGRGIGMFAKAKISAHQCLCSEAPLVFGVGSLSDAIGKLTVHDRDRFWALHDWHASDSSSIGVATLKTVDGIFSTNALPCGPDQGAVFPTLARVNHACAPNAAAHWDAGAVRKFLVALRDIEPMEEICISYTSPFDGYERRKRTLTEKFGFLCNCSICSLSHAERESDDQRRSELHDTLVAVAQLTPTRLSSGLAVVTRLLHLLMEMAAAPITIARAAFDVSELCHAYRDRNSFVLWLKVYAFYMELAEGPDSHDTRAAVALMESTLAE